MLTSLLAGVLTFHPLHASVCTIEYNAQSHRFELSVRVYRDDLARALSTTSGHPIRIDSAGPELDVPLLRYLEKHLILRGPEGATLPLALETRENDQDVLWVHLATEWDRPPTGIQVEDTIFFELFTDQTNLVHFKVGTKVKSSLFQPGESPREF